MELSPGGRSARRFPVACLLAATIAASSQGLRAQPGPQNGRDPFGVPSESVVNDIFPPAPRELRQHVSRAEAAIAEERFSDAVAELGQVLGSAQGDDFFLGDASEADSQISLKTQALALLGSLPAKGRRMYELQFGADAKAALEEALNAGDLGQLTEVCRRYFHTQAGYEATLLLGRMQLDQGRPLAAALTLKRVADVPYAAAQYDPELSVLLAACWMHAGQEVQATATLRGLKQRIPNAKVQLVDKQVGLFARDDDALRWLEQIVGGVRAAGRLTAKEWVVYRGNAARNAESLGGVPLLNFSWKLPTVNDPQDEARVAQKARAARDGGEPLVSALQPLVVQDYAIIRQPETSKLIGINLKKNGKREWVFPPFDENASLQAARQSAQAARASNVNAREQELKQRIWDDNTFGQVSSDGQQVYVIDDLGYAAIPNVTTQQWIVMRGGVRVPNTNGAKPHNLLVALDLKRQGYQVWAVGGETGDQPALAGAFFLGPPLPVGGQLFALAEFNGEVRLVAINPRDGSLEWKQQLAVLDEGQQITSDTTRRLAGASPSYADGILICPTSAGAVVAVDLATRTLRWGYTYGRADLQRTRTRFGSQTSRVNDDDGHWLDATATIADGAVILTPVESEELHCLDLLTGKPRWPARPRDDALFVACVHEDKIVLVGNSVVKAINLADGKDAWKEPVRFEDDVPTGRGYYSDGHYFLPVTGQQLLKIDLGQGKVVGRAQTEIDLGNVVAYQDQLISLSPQYAASFVLLSESLQKKLEDRLANNPDDVEALSLQGQILLQEGKADESLALLRRAHRLVPDKATVRGLLVKVMLALLRQDFTAHLELTDELDKLVTDPAQRREVLRWRIQGLARGDKPWEAFQAVIELADFELNDEARSAGEPLDRIDREHSVRTDRWLQGQLQQLYKTADAATKERMSAEIKLRLDRTLEAGDTGRLRAFLNLFGFHDFGQLARLALVDRLIASGGLLEAEVLAGELLDAQDRTVAGRARGALAALYEQADRLDLAASQYRMLGAALADVVCRDGKTGSELAQRAAENAALAPWLAASWPFGAVEVKEEGGPAGANRILFNRLQYPIEIREFAGAAPRGLRAAYDPQQQQLSVKSETGRPLAVASLRNSDNNYRRYFNIPNSLVSGKAHGHLIVVSMGTEVAAIDALRGEGTGDGALLWRQDAVEIDPSQTRSMYPQQRASNNPLTGVRYVSYDPSGKLNFGTGPISSAGVCFQKGRQLVCVDPLTGEALWERSGMPAQAEIFGDGDSIFVAEPDGDPTLVLNAIDGTLLEKRSIDRDANRWATCGRNVLAWQQGGAAVGSGAGAIKVRLYDPLDLGNDLWSATVTMGTRGCLIDGEELALLEPGGQFTVVSLVTGDVVFSVPLDAPAEGGGSGLAWINVIRSADQYLLLAAAEGGDGSPGVMIQPVQTAGGNQQGRFQGRVHAFSRSTGKLQWQTPAALGPHGLPADQPTESPLLLFVANRTENKGGASRSTTSVLAIDRRDGRVVFDKDTAINTATTHCEIEADAVKDNVTLTLWASTASKPFVFQLTDKPTPPAPPALTGDQASADAGRPAGTVDRSVGLAIERLNRGLPPRALLPPAPR